MTIQKIENFIHKNYQEQLKSLIENGSLPVYFNTKTVFKDEYSDITTKHHANEIDTFQFGHVFIQCDQIISNYWNIVDPINYALLASHGVGFNKKLNRCKLNLNTAMPNIDDSKHYTIHKDHIAENAISGIYYINDADGDTLFFDNDGNIVDRITPKQGLFVCFDTTTFHAGQPPKKYSYRALINFVWV